METPTANSTPRPGFFRRVFHWRGVRKVLFVLAALITLGALLFAEEDWRGARAWANYKRDREAKGERFDAARLFPPKVPDDQNFAMTPYFAPLFDLPPEVLRQPLQFVTNVFDGIPVVALQRDTNRERDLKPNLPVTAISNRFTWQYALATDLIVWAKAFMGTNSPPPPAPVMDPVQAASIVLDNLKPCEPTLAELQSACARPSSRFNIPYEEWDNRRVQSAVMMHLAVFKQLYQILSLHAESEMVLGRTGPALDDINVMFRIDDGLKYEPLILSQLVRMICITYMLQPVGDGLAERRWSEAQLRVLQERLQKTDLIAATVQALHGERDIYVNLSSVKLYPGLRGWNRLEQLHVNRAFQESVFPRIDLAARRISPSVNHSIELAFEKSEAGRGGVSALLHLNIIARRLIPGLANVPEKAALAQSGVDMAMVACALERFRLARGQYPEDLNALVPSFAAALPHDIINGQPLKYRRTDNGRFILYSVGWNEKDDGGVVATKGKPPIQDTKQGDWVWQYPEKL